jgi:phosphatidylglycerol:prolipoprotein diacylglycerol transferase
MDYVHMCTDPSQVESRITEAECAQQGAKGIWEASTSDPSLMICRATTRDCFWWARFWAGGLTYYGGFLGASLAAWFLLKRDRFPFWKAADMAGFAVPIGLTFGRMGCLLAGCCFGVRCELPWAIVYPMGIDANGQRWGSQAAEAQWKAGELPSSLSDSLPVHPAPVYEALATLVIAAVCLLVVHPRKRYDGQVFAAFLALYAVARFLLEYMRDDERGGVLGLSTSQLIGVLLLAAAVLVHLWRRPRATGVAATA